MSIFISYAKEDVDQARALYLALEDRGLGPWMDKPPPPHGAKGLVPGENWRARLEAEIRAARRAILLLSKTSVAKVGYVQREFRLALDVMNLMPANARFAVPLMIDDCAPPELVVDRISLSDLQWTTLNEIGMGVFIDLIEADLAA
jgi:TIR domain